MNKNFIRLAAVISAIYLINPTAGFLELIPDNIPIIGNLDEGMAAWVLFSAISYLLGKDIGMFAGKKGSQKVDTLDEGEL